MIKAVSALHRIESSVSLLKSPNFRLEKVTHSLFLCSASLISIFPLLGFGVLPLFALEEGAIRIQQRRKTKLRQKWITSKTWITQCFGREFPLIMVQHYLFHCIKLMGCETFMSSKFLQSFYSSFFLFFINTKFYFNNNYNNFTNRLSY